MKKTAKLYPQWLGPYQVMKLIPPLLTEIRAVDVSTKLVSGPPRVVCIDRLARWDNFPFDEMVGEEAFREPGQPRQQYAPDPAAGRQGHPR